MKTLIVFNHPYKGSFCRALLDAAVDGVRSGGSEVDVIDLDKDGFNPVMTAEDLRAFTVARNDEEKAFDMIDTRVLQYKRSLERVEHLVFIFPIWWSLMPALTKGFIDKVVFPGIVYRYGEDDAMYSALQMLKKVTIVTTMNTPKGVYSTLMGNAVWYALKYGTFVSIGINDVKWLSYNMVKQSSDETRKEWIEEVRCYFGNVKE